MATRFEEVYQELLEQRQDQSEMTEEIEDLQANQSQINAGVKELETLIIKRFETMAEVEEEAKRLKEAKETALGEGGAADDDEQDLAGLDPAARRQLRRQQQRRRRAGLGGAGP